MNLSGKIVSSTTSMSKYDEVIFYAEIVSNTLAYTVGDGTGRLYIWSVFQKISTV